MACHLTCWSAGTNANCGRCAVSHAGERTGLVAISFLLNLYISGMPEMAMQLSGAERIGLGWVGELK